MKTQKRNIKGIWERGAGDTGDKAENIHKHKVRGKQSVIRQPKILQNGWVISRWQWPQ